MKARAAASVLCAALGTACGLHGPEARAFAPGLGEIMSSQQMRHLKLWYAGLAGNWALAAYELDELEEGFDDAVRLHPTHPGVPRPLRELVPEFTAGPLRSLRQAVEGRRPEDFAAAFDALSQGCNGCHAAASFAFNVIARPTSNPYSNQRFEAPDR